MFYCALNSVRRFCYLYFSEFKQCSKKGGRGVILAWLDTCTCLILDHKTSYRGISICLPTIKRTFLHKTHLIQARKTKHFKTSWRSVNIIMIMKRSFYFHFRYRGVPNRDRTLIICFSLDGYVNRLNHSSCVVNYGYGCQNWCKFIKPYHFIPSHRN